MGIPTNHNVLFSRNRPIPIATAMATRNTRKAAFLITLSCFVSQPVLASTNQHSSLDLPTLVQTCAPDVHPNTMMKLLTHESGTNPYIIGVNVKPRRIYRPQDHATAVRTAQQLLAEGKSIDMGLGQIWSGNLKGLGLTLEQVFDPCTNVRVAGQLLGEAYERARKVEPSEAAALDQALSIYNTGRFNAGISNGYVARVRGVQYRVPALDPEAGTAEPTKAAEPPAVVTAKLPDPPPAWDVFASANYQGPRPAAAAEAAPAASERSEAPAQPILLFSDDR